MKFRPCTQEDMAFVRQNPYEGAIKDYPYMQAPDENSYTVLYESQIVAVGGLQMRWEGTGILWLMLTDDSKKHGFHGLFALEAIKEKMNEMIEANGVWRAEAIVRTDFPQAIKMIEWFGFEREGCMRKCCPDKHSAYLYAKVI